MLASVYHDESETFKAFVVVAQLMPLRFKHLKRDKSFG
jgi:hypothetical protein